MGASRRLRIADDAGERMLEPRIDQRADQGHGIGVAARAGIVLGVDEDHRSAALRRRSLDDLERTIDREDLERELAFPAVHALGERTRGCARRCGLVPAGVDGGPAFGNVRCRKPAGEPDRDERRTIEVDRFVHQGAHRIDQRRLRGERHQEIELLERVRRPWPADQVMQAARRSGAARGHVDVGIRPERQQRGCKTRHLRRQVGVEVEARDDRKIRADHSAQSTQQFTVCIVDVLSDHGAVQVQVNRVDGAGGPELIDHHRAHALEGVAGDVPGRLRLAPEQR